MPQKTANLGYFFCRQLKVAEKLKKKFFEKKLHFAHLVFKNYHAKKNFSLKKYILNIV